MIYIELWQDVCDGDVRPNKPTDVDSLAKWEIKNAKALALIKFLVNDEMCVHIENSYDSLYSWKQIKDLIDTQPKYKRVDLQLKLLQLKLIEGQVYLSTFPILRTLSMK